MGGTAPGSVCRRLRSCAASRPSCRSMELVASVSAFTSTAGPPPLVGAAALEVAVAS